MLVRRTHIPDTKGKGVHEHIFGTDPDLFREIARVFRVHRQKQRLRLTVKVEQVHRVERYSQLERQGQLKTLFLVGDFSRKVADRHTDVQALEPGSVEDSKVECDNVERVLYFLLRGIADAGGGSRTIRDIARFDNARAEVLIHELHVASNGEFVGQRTGIANADGVGIRFERADVKESLRVVGEDGRLDLAVIDILETDPHDAVVSPRRGKSDRGGGMLDIPDPADLAQGSFGEHSEVCHPGRVVEHGTGIPVRGGERIRKRSLARVQSHIQELHAGLCQLLVRSLRRRKGGKQGDNDRHEENCRSTMCPFSHGKYPMFDVFRCRVVPRVGKPGEFRHFTYRITTSFFITRSPLSLFSMMTR